LETSEDEDYSNDVVYNVESSTRSKRTQKATNPTDRKLRSESGKEEKLLTKPIEVNTERNRRSPIIRKGLSQVDKFPPYNVADNILNMPIRANVGQILRYPDQRRNMYNSWKKTYITEETNYASNVERKTSAVRCRVRIKGNPLIAVLDSGAAVSIITNKLMKKIGLAIGKPSNVFVITANGNRTRALGQIAVNIAIQDVSIPTELQVIESTEETLLLGTDWFTKTNAELSFGSNTVRLRYLNKSITVPITHYANEDPKCIAMEDQSNFIDEDDEWEEEYEDEDIDEIPSTLPIPLILTVIWSITHSQIMSPPNVNPKNPKSQNQATSKKPSKMKSKKRTLQYILHKLPISLRRKS
jgi:hypothetical protein